jgi:UDP-N-acetylmuramoylalanine--D-glutamate ligase
MLIIYGKGEMGKGVKALCDALGMPAVMMDDADRDETVLRNTARIVVTPGISPKHQLYQKFGDRCVSELDFIAWLATQYERMQNLVTIGITGTKGKSTTTWMTYNLLKSFAPAGWDVHITGNFKTPVSQTLANIMNAHETAHRHLLVVESSSFMLHHTQNFHFDFGIRTNFSPDHLDRHADLAEYFAAKARIITHTHYQSVVDHPIFASLEE